MYLHLPVKCAGGSKKSLAFFLTLQRPTSYLTDTAPSASSGRAVDKGLKSKTISVFFPPSPRQSERNSMEGVFFRSNSIHTRFYYAGGQSGCNTSQRSITAHSKLWQFERTKFMLSAIRN